MPARIIDYEPAKQAPKIQSDTVTFTMTVMWPYFDYLKVEVSIRIQTTDQINGDCWLHKTNLQPCNQVKKKMTADRFPYEASSCFLNALKRSYHHDPNM